MSKEIMVAGEVTAVQLYTDGKIKTIVERIKEEVLLVVPVVETKKGRDEIKSLAYKISRAKTTMDNLGKELTAEAQKTVKLVNEERKKMRDEMDELKAEVRKPLTDYENAEKERIAAINIRINGIVSLRNELDAEGVLYGSEYLVEKLAESKAIVLDDSFGDQLKSAALEKDVTINQLEKSISTRKKEEDEARELARLRQEAEERKKKEYEDNLKKQAAEKAKREAEEKAAKEKLAAERQASQEKEEAEQKARDEQQRLEDEKAELERRAEEAEKKRLADIQAVKDQAAKAKEEAERERLTAIQAAKDQAEKEKQELIAKQQEEKRLEQERIASEKAADEAARKAEEDRIAKEKAADDARKRDKEHRRIINANICLALVAAGLADHDAQTVVKAVALGRVPNMEINY